MSEQQKVEANLRTITKALETTYQFLDCAETSVLLEALKRQGGRVETEQEAALVVVLAKLADLLVNCRRLTRRRNELTAASMQAPPDFRQRRPR